MTGLDFALAGWLPLTCYGLAVVSAVLPWVNAEVLVVAVAAATASWHELAIVVATVTAGQLTGKSMMYWAVRHARVMPTPRVERLLDRWRGRVDGRPRLALKVVFASAAFGLPPLYLVTIASGALRIAFWPFLAVSACGRVLHFGALALLPGVVNP